MERHTTAIPANLARTMPYTSYVAVMSYAVIFESSAAAWLTFGLIFNELLNAGTKWALLRVTFGNSAMLRRPEGAVDSGIYPKHNPGPSSTSGMPSGHSQSAGFLAAILTNAVLRQPLETSSGAVETATLGLRFAVVPPILYIWLIAIAVMVSRTRFGGPLAVKFRGRSVAHHTILQVVVGAVIGSFLGLAAVEWYDGRRCLPWLCLVAAQISLIAVVAAVDARSARRRGVLDKPGGSDIEWPGKDRVSGDRTESSQDSRTVFASMDGWQSKYLIVDYAASPGQAHV